MHGAQHSLVARIQDGSSMLTVLFPGLGPWIWPAGTSGSIPREESSITRWRMGSKCDGKYCRILLWVLGVERQDERETITHRCGPSLCRTWMDRAFCRTLVMKLRDSPRLTVPTCFWSSKLYHRSLLLHK